MTGFFEGAPRPHVGCCAETSAVGLRWHSLLFTQSGEWVRKGSSLKPSCNYLCDLSVLRGVRRWLVEEGGRGGGCIKRCKEEEWRMQGANVLVMFLIDFLEQARVTSKQICVKRSRDSAAFKGGQHAERLGRFVFLLLIQVASRAELQLRTGGDAIKTLGVMSQGCSKFELMHACSRLRRIFMRSFKSLALHSGSDQRRGTLFGFLDVQIFWNAESSSLSGWQGWQYVKVLSLTELYIFNFWLKNIAEDRHWLLDVVDNVPPFSVWCPSITCKYFNIQRFKHFSSFQIEKWKKLQVDVNHHRIFSQLYNIISFNKAFQQRIVLNLMIHFLSGGTIRLFSARFQKRKKRKKSCAKSSSQYLISHY